MDDPAPMPAPGLFSLGTALGIHLAGAGRGLLRGGRTAVRRAFDFVLPPTCMACKRAVDAPGCLCASCWARLEFLPEPGDGADDDAHPAYGRARAVVRFGEVARDLVHGLKYADRLDIADPLAGLMARAGQEVLAGADALVPVPLHRRRLFKRRFNQSALLAQGMARRCGVPVRTGWLERVRMTRPQVGLDREARTENVAGAFHVPEMMKAELAGRRVVLVDDVMTTGATLDACTKALSRAGAARVDVLVFARVVDEARGAIS